MPAINTHPQDIEYSGSVAHVVFLLSTNDRENAMVGRPLPNRPERILPAPS